MLREKISGRLIAALAAALLLTGCGSRVYAFTENTQLQSGSGEAYETLICDGRVCGRKIFAAGNAGSAVKIVNTEKKAPRSKPVPEKRNTAVRKRLMYVSSIFGIPVILRAEQD